MFYKFQLLSFERDKRGQNQANWNDDWLQEVSHLKEIFEDCINFWNNLKKWPDPERSFIFGTDIFNVKNIHSPDELSSKILFQISYNQIKTSTINILFVTFLHILVTFQILRRKQFKISKIKKKVRRNK